MDTIKLIIQWIAIVIFSVWGSLFLAMLISEVYSVVKSFFKSIPTPQIEAPRLYGQEYARELAVHAELAQNFYYDNRYLHNGRVYIRDAAYPYVLREVENETTKGDYFKIPKRNVPGWL